MDEFQASKGFNGTDRLDNVRITALICGGKGKVVPVLN
jgi:hypothetical protein